MAIPSAHIYQMYIFVCFRAETKVVKVGEGVETVQIQIVEEKLALGILLYFLFLDTFGLLDRCDPKLLQPRGAF